MTILNIRQSSKIILTSLVIIALSWTSTSASPFEDYRLRGIVIEALVDTADIRQDIINYYQENNKLPKSNADIDRETPFVLETGDEVVLNEEGFILHIKSQEPRLLDKSIEFKLYQGEDRMEWDCSGGSLPYKLRTSICRNDSE